MAEVASTGDYLDLSNRPTLGTAAALNVGTGPNQVVQLTANSRLPAVDGSLLINLPSQIPSQAGNAGKVITTNGTALSWINVLLDWNTTSTKTTNYNASNLDKIPCNTSSGSFTVTLPPSGKVWIIDIIGNSPTTGFGAIGKHLTVSPPVGQTVMGAASLILSTGAATVQLELFGTDWRIVMRG